MLTYAPSTNILKGRDDVDIQKAGFLFKQTSNSLRKWKEYYFRLGRVSLLCYRKDTDVRDDKQPKFKVELADIDSVEQTHKKNKPGKQFLLMFNQGVLYLRSEEIADAKDWINKLTEAVAICKKRRDLQAELMRASFKMAVEQNLRNKYVHSNPQKPVTEMPKKTFLRRIDFKEPKLLENKVNILPPLRPDKRCISIGGNMISKRDNMACFQGSRATPYWKDKNYKTIYKNFNKDSLRKTLLKKNASRELLPGEKRSEDSMIITNNLSFEDDDNKVLKAYTYTSLDGLNRLTSLQRCHSEIIQGPNTPRNEQNGVPEPCVKPILHPPAPKPSTGPPPPPPKYSSAALFGKDFQDGRNNIKMGAIRSQSVCEGSNYREAERNELNKPFSRQSMQYSSYQPARHEPSFQRDHLAYRSLNTYQQVRPLPHLPPLNTISENESGSRSSINSSMRQSEALPLFPRRPNIGPTNLSQRTNIYDNYKNPYAAPVQNKNKIARSLSSNQNYPAKPPGQLNNVGYMHPWQQNEAPKVVTRSNTFTSNHPIYSRGCYAHVKGAGIEELKNRMCAPQMVACGVPGASLWRHANCIQ